MNEESVRMQERLAKLIHIISMNHRETNRRHILIALNECPQLSSIERTHNADPNTAYIINIINVMLILLD